MPQSAVFGIFVTIRQVENAVEELKASGFRSSNVAIHGGPGLSIPEPDAARFAEMVRRGHILLAVRTESDCWRERAGRILSESGAIEISGCAVLAGASQAT
jgi:hypothetical protein